MAERKGLRRFKCSCVDCIHLDKERFKGDDVNKWYGCNYGSRDCVVGAVTKDSELKNMGCSNCNRVRPGDVLEVTTVLGTVCQYLFCGTVGKHFKAGLFYFRKYVKAPKGAEERRRTELYKVFQYGEMEQRYRSIKHIRLNPVQEEAAQRIAKKRRKVWLEKNVKSSDRD